MNALDHVFGKVFGSVIGSKTWGCCYWQNGSLQNDTQHLRHHWCDETVYFLCVCVRKPTLSSDRLQRLLLSFLISSAHTSDRRSAGYVTPTFPKQRLALVLQRSYRKNTRVGEWWRYWGTKYWWYVCNVEIQGITIKSGELIAKSDMDRCKREGCNYGVVCFIHLKHGKRFVVFEKVVNFVPDQHVSVFSKCQVESLLIIFGPKELLRGDGFACKITQVTCPVIILTLPFDRPESTWVNMDSSPLESNSSWLVQFLS